MYDRHLRFTLILLIVIAQTFCADILPRVGVTSGAIAWRLARFRNYSEFRTASGASNFTRMKELVSMDKVVAYDNDGNMIFSREDMPPVYLDNQSDFLILRDGFAYFYLDYGFASQPLFLQLFSKDGVRTGEKLTMAECHQFSVVGSRSSENTLLIAWIESRNSTIELSYRLVDSGGRFLTSPILLDSVIWNESVDMFSLSTSSVVNGGFLINWVGLDETTQQFVIKSAYIAAQHPTTYAGPAILADHQDTGFLRLLSCGGIQVDEGHTCLYEHWGSISGSMVERATYMLTFAYTGSVRSAPILLDRSIVDSSTARFPKVAATLPYGGLLLSDPQNHTVSLIDGQEARFLQGDIGTSISILPNNTVLSLNQSSGAWSVVEGWSVVSTNIPKTLPESKYDNNPIITSTFPSIGSVVSISTNNLSITFLQNPQGYLQSTGKLAIYRSRDPYHPRQIIPVSEGVVAHDFQAQILPSTLNSPDSEYFVVVDPGAFIASAGNPVPGIPPNVWKFRTQKDTESVYFQIRLSSPGDSMANLADELQSFLPIAESGRLRAKLLRTEDSLDVYQVKIGGGENVQRSAMNLYADFRVMLEHKEISILSFGNATRLIDAQYGATMEADVVWHYPAHLAIIGAAAILLVFYAFCRYRYPSARNSMVIVTGLCAYSFVVSTLFVLVSSEEVKQLQMIASILYILPYVLNMILVLGIIVRQVSGNAMFYVWLSNRTFVTTIVTLISASNPALLTLLSSRIFGIDWLDAPVSEGFHKRVIYAIMVNVVTKDVPFLVIQSLFRKLYGYFKIIPYLCLVSCVVNILMGITLCAYHFWYRPKGLMALRNSSDSLSSSPSAHQKHSSRVSSFY
ncbi:hypothetical protein K493DRAFT_307482 [Basidiobolus meristosporus CBS 931.73]|uniref:Uncharacterized protein n=1 Tax=Basidiobolus meristosporus CBS 931.73 TaxID=1314790 RepID=A0A1Y1XER5_9FUNG|nr:hypothetical protein K493DRAFT_307482 [Basidiobolus meristosporus CBS 931.73]|eukprot:ORX84213.1 hypothetical protein K493DRAFT_307482 [Basidiobolus meristosporus CBS 931.73]